MAPNRLAIGFLYSLARRALALRNAAMPSATYEQRIVWDHDLRLFIDAARQEWPYAPVQAAVVVCINEALALVRYDGRSLPDALRTTRNRYRL